MGLPNKAEREQLRIAGVATRDALAADQQRAAEEKRIQAECELNLAIHKRTDQLALSIPLRIREAVKEGKKRLDVRICDDFPRRGHDPTKLEVEVGERLKTRLAHPEYRMLTCTHDFGSNDPPDRNGVVDWIPCNLWALIIEWD